MSNEIESDRTVWICLGVEAQLKKLHNMMYDAIINHSGHVTVTIDGSTIGEFTPKDDGRVIWVSLGDETPFGYYLRD